MREIDRALYIHAIEKWGEQAQFIMVQEECMELSLAVSRYIRGRVASSAVLEEMADVSLMIEQLQVILDIPDKVLDNMKKMKLNRLSGLLSKEGEE